MQIECPSGPDIMKGPGNESGRECSGRGLCKYELGFCDCFIGILLKYFIIILFHFFIFFYSLLIYRFLWDKMSTSKCPI